MSETTNGPQLTWTSASSNTPPHGDRESRFTAVELRHAAAELRFGGVSIASTAQVEGRTMMWWDVCDQAARDAEIAEEIRHTAENDGGILGDYCRRLIVRAKEQP